MRRIILPLFITLSFFIFQTGFAQSSICLDTTGLYLDIDGEATFDVDQIMLDTSTYDSVSIDQSFFDCNDLGFRELEIQFYSRDTMVDSCQAVFQIIDSIAPVINLDIFQNVYIEASDTTHFTISDYDGNIYDNCSIDSIIYSKTDFDSSHIKDSLVTVTIIDQSGNQSKRDIEVEVQIIDCEEEEFTCKNQISVNLMKGDVKITPEDIINPKIRNCNITTTPIIWLSGSGDTLQIPNNILTEDYLNTTLGAVITDTSTGDFCGTLVHIESCYPFLEQKIGWPEDFNIQFSCAEDSLPDLSNLSIETLQDYFNVNPEFLNVDFSAFCPEARSYLYANYEDTYIYTDSVHKIIRLWSVLNWLDGQTYQHNQLIKVFPGSNFTLPLECFNERRLHIGQEQYRVITKEFVLSNNSFLVCDSAQMSFLDMDLNPIQFPGNKIYRDYEDPFFYAVLESEYSQESCMIKVIIQTTPLSCHERFHICDQLPYGQSFNDCDSNYTTADNIEWPRDINVALCSDRISDASPEYLMSQNEIAAKNAYPEVVLEGCIPIHVNLNYSDSFPDAGSQIFPQRIIRTWQVEVDATADAPHSNSWTYDQLITVEQADTCDHIFQIRTGSGLPVPNVAIENGYVSGQNGIIDLENYPFDSIHPVYTDTSMVSDISIEDLRLLNKALDKEIYLNTVQRIAADANLDGQVDDDDLEALYNYIFEGTPLQKNWVFVKLDSSDMQMEGHFQVASYSEKTTYESVENAYEYLGIRIGDIDQSVFMQEEEVGDTLTVFVENKQLNQTESIRVPVFIEEDVPLAALQFSFHFDPEYLRFVGLEGDENNINSSNYNQLNDSTIVFSWNEVNAQAVARGEKDQAVLSPFMDLYFIAMEDGALCDRISLDTMPLPKEAVYYNDQFDITYATLNLNCEGQVTSSPYPETVDFIIYPNPAEDQIYIQWGNNSVGSKYTYKILNSHGSVLLTQEAQQLSTISLSDIPTGVYWLEILQDGKAAAVKKFVVQK